MRSHKIFLIYLPIAILLLFVYPVYANSVQQKIDSTIQPEKFIEYGYTLSKKNQQAAFLYFRKGAVYYKQQKNTSAYLECMLGISELEKRSGKFNNAFETLWSILPLAKNDTEKSSFSKIHRKLGILYGIYGKDSLSLVHLNKGLNTIRTTGEANELSGAYFSIAEQYINMNELNNALTYLDSCYISQPTKKRLIYTDAYYAHIYTKKGNLPKAKAYLKNLVTEFEKNRQAFLAMVYSFQADYYLQLKQRDAAIYFYKKAIETIDTMKVHIEIKPRILEELANLHFINHKKEEAYAYMKAAKAISDTLFHTQSKHNKALFEIKNNYQEALNKKEAQIIAQNKLLSLKDKAEFRLKLLIFILIVLTAVAFFTFRQRSKIKNMLYQREKKDAILHTRNKELTANALQIIEKENAVKELLDTIKEHVPDQFKPLNSKYRKTNEKIWDDFHLRFTKTNNKFYEKLLKLHPTLTPTDLKHCALIRLKFDSKEMSKILGISLHSVHMARSRVRKKLNLSREESLSNYIAVL
ncbi:tetratricopeptide repeat protein [Flavicella sediminum]|uniref:hypothetical protein n=1 Tax=Flavicella sediminum TaxID=2585141 RepID=UPI00111E9B82|nr:hypothetical protein [Flavicella sediminum]